MRNLMIWTMLLAAFSGQAKDHKKIATSGANQVQLVELFSSESCSSCPPADYWISSLKDRPGLWTGFVPVVFHVDYWNDLGWKDELSSNSMTKRQQEIAKTWESPSVYTPAVIVNGQEWRQWSTGSLPSGGMVSNFRLTVYQEAADEFQVVIEGLEQKSSNDSYTIRIAKLGMGLSSNVTSGENSGRRLTHNFVVLDWDSKPVTSGSSALTFRFSSSGKSAPKMAIAAWIEKNGKPVSLQATGGYL